MPSWTWSRHLRPSSSSSSYLFSLLLIISTATEFTDATQCYHSDGTPTDASFQPCDPDAEFSACCATNKPDADICLSSGLCLAQQIGYSGLVFQNGCTDQSWSSSSCPRVCPGFASDDGIGVIPCPEVSRGSWCCLTSSGENCCEDAFPLSVGTVMIASATSSPPDNVPTCSAPPTTTSANSQEAASTGSNNSSNTNVECPTGPDPTILGVGVGASLGACLLLALIALWWQGRSYRRKLRDATVALIPVGESDSKNGFYGPPGPIEVSEAPVPSSPIYEISGIEKT